MLKIHHSSETCDAYVANCPFYVLILSHHIGMNKAHTLDILLFYCLTSFHKFIVTLICFNHLEL